MSDPKPVARTPRGRKAMKRTYTKRMSDKRKDKIAEEQPIRRAWLRFRPTCEWPMEHTCIGGLTVHEPWTRARGGPTDDPRNMATVDAETNRRISQDAYYMDSAYVFRLLVHAAAGPAWLAAGGRNPGKTRDEMLKMIGVPA